MKKLLFIVNSLGAGGAEKHVVSLVNHLDADEFPGTLASLHPGADLLCEIVPGRVGEVVFCNVRQRVDVRVVQQLAELVDRAGIDVILCTNPYAMLYGVRVRASAKRKPRLVVVFHTTLLGSWRQRFQMAFYWPLFRRCDQLIYVCENQRAHWRRLGVRAVADTRIYNGIDTVRFAPVPEPEVQRMRAELGFGRDDLVVGICAGMRREKAHVDLLAAVARLRGAGVPARCLFVGDGVERAAIVQRIGQLGLGNAVRIVGFQADVRPYVAACDVMALVSHAVETFSISALESMALERPMVMSRIGGAAEQVTDGVDGYTFKAGDIDELVSCLGKLADPEVRRAMGANARRTIVERFDLDTMVRGYEDLLRAVPDAR